MPKGGIKGNKGNTSNHTRKWRSTDFASPKLPRHIMPTIYKVAIALDHDPDLEQKLKDFLDSL